MRRSRLRSRVVAKGRCVSGWCCVTEVFAGNRFLLATAIVARRQGACVFPLLEKSLSPLRGCCAKRIRPMRGLPGAAVSSEGAP